MTKRLPRKDEHLHLERMREFIDRANVTDYAVFQDYCRDYKRDWAVVLKNAAYAHSVRRYIQSRKEVITAYCDTKEQTQ